MFRFEPDPMEKGWPCQRLRMGYGLVMFFVFEVTWGRQLPEALPFVLLGLGLALLASAYESIRSWQLHAKIRLIQEAVEEARQTGRA